MKCARIVRSALVLAVLVVIGGCASSEQWSDWRSHSTHFASDRHMGFSMRNNMEGTRGKVITVQPDQIFQN